MYLLHRNYFILIGGNSRGREQTRINHKYYIKLVVAAMSLVSFFTASNPLFSKSDLGGSTATCSLLLE